jgi:anti-anti-sigma regulatory factor/HAMP domain-containing protein
MRLRTTLILLLTMVGILSAGTVGVMSYVESLQALQTRSVRQLTAARDLRADQVEDYFRHIRHQLVTQAENPTTAAAMQAFAKGFSDKRAVLAGDTTPLSTDDDLRAYYDSEFLPELARKAARDGVSPADFWTEDRTARHFQGRYIATNPHPTGSKHLLNTASDEQGYDAAHQQYHPLFRSYLERFGYYDIFLIDPDTGHIVYSVFKEVDYGTSLLSGPYRNSNLARAFAAARESTDASYSLLVDFEPYSPSYDAHAAFIASPIVVDDQVVGVLAFQMPIDRLNAIMTSHQQWQAHGFGLSGETYIVGSDKTLRSESRFLLEDPSGYLTQLEATGVAASVRQRIDSQQSAIGIQPIQTEAVTSALLGERGTGTVTDYRGVEVLSAFRPLDITDVTWVLLSEIDTTEALGDATVLRNHAFILQLFVLTFVVILAFLFAGRLVAPIHELVEMARRIGAGDLSATVRVRRSDELGDLAEGFETMRASLQEFVSRQDRALEALAAPMIPLSDAIVAAPLVGEMDPKRMEHTRKTLTTGVYEMRARALLLDLTGVPALDEAAYDGLLDVIDAIELLGAVVVVTGMRPAVAEVFAGSGARNRTIIAERTLQEGHKTARAMLAAKRG